MFVLPQIAYGNTALIFPSHFQGYSKNEIFPARPPRFIRDSSLIRPAQGGLKLQAWTLAVLPHSTVFQKF
jgi:hypothetical protein